MKVVAKLPKCMNCTEAIIKSESRVVNSRRKKNSANADITSFLYQVYMIFKYLSSVDDDVIPAGFEKQVLVSHLLSVFIRGF